MMKNPLGFLLAFGLIGYLVYAFFKSKKDGMLELPGITGRDGKPAAASNSNPDEFADDLYNAHVKNKGIFAVLHPGTMAMRDGLYKSALMMSNDQLIALNKAWNAKYKDSGALLNVINAANGDPFDTTHSKTRLVGKLRSLNLK